MVIHLGFPWTVKISNVCGRVSELQLPRVSSWVEQNHGGKNHINYRRQTTPSVQLTRPPGRNISNFLFPSYGTPVGNCESYARGTCHSVYSRAIAELVSIILSLSLLYFSLSTIIGSTLFLDNPQHDHNVHKS